MTSPIRDTRSMIQNMSPDLQTESFIYCTTDDPSRILACQDQAIGMFVEPEGRSFILPLPVANDLGFDCSMPMRQIVLKVHSSLEGVGLTAAVATALADKGIACNMVAAFHHDHVFLPEGLARQAMLALRALQDAQV